ncbi:MAG: DUF1738 domain-containing protein [Candidatus Marinimicrobia bacterium]|jgi:antirestriction protein ArdC|nr:DUF1738 domain-containing protein [Candidatus Neomarinimicrobiota bacterium]MBT4684398.1 DUF1738 domain-containing protein [Candidatus Neomarinimicrobiota bacterium]
MKNDIVYQMVTNNIIAMLEEGKIPWHQSWTGITPMNLITGFPYRGVNVWLLGPKGYSNPYWLTFKQAIDKGGHVKKGQKGTIIVFWKAKQIIQNDSELEAETIPLLRYYKVFNVEQCEDIEYPSWEKADNDSIEKCDDVVKGYSNCPEIKPDLSKAYYSPADDFIGMPSITQFESSEEYYSTLFHELTHSTGHTSRLNRNTIKTGHSFDSTDYSKEELIAEMGASFLCNITRIDNAAVTKNNAGYIQGWLERLKEDKRLIIQASSRAQKSTDYILGIENKYKEKQNDNTKHKSNNSELKDAISAEQPCFLENELSKAA